VKPAARISAAAVFLVLVVVGTMRQGDTREFTATSYGAVPSGHGAIYALLGEAGLPVARSFASPEALPPQRTIWWIAPERPLREDGTERPSAFAGEAFARWLEEGGTAVLLLGEDGLGSLEVAGAALPALEPPPRDDEPQAGHEPLGSPWLDGRLLWVEGRLLPQRRTLELPVRRGFVEESVDAAVWRSVARIEGEPFVLERTLGDGRLVLVSDARFLTNRWLDRAESAPFALDLVRAYGVPWIDEHEHGFVATRGALRYLAGSPALPFFLGLALLGMGLAWAGAALPPRLVQELDPSAPTLETFVSSLGRFYAGTHDYRRVLDRYRELTARRLRRRFGLPPDAPLAALAERLGRRRRVTAAGLALLVDGETPRNVWALAQSVALLDQLAHEAEG
jgi:hypothetical protein